MDITSDLTLSLEARYAKDKKTIAAPYSCQDPAAHSNGQQLKDATDNDALTPRITLSWQATEDIMFTALAAKGNKPAEFNDAYFRATVQGTLAVHWKPEQKASHKLRKRRHGPMRQALKPLGLMVEHCSTYRYSLLNGKTKPFSRPSLLATSLPTLRPMRGRSEVFGLELESSFAVTENLIASLSYGLADGKYKRFNSDFIALQLGEGLIPGTATLDPNANNAEGNRIPFSPKQSVVGSLAYTHQLRGAVDWFARTDAIWESKRYTGAANFLVLPARTIWNGRLGLESDGWSITGYVSNILNDETPQSAPKLLVLLRHTIKHQLGQKLWCGPCRTRH